MNESDMILVLMDIIVAMMAVAVVYHHNHSKEN
jgi:hypothetical protein